MPGHPPRSVPRRPSRGSQCRQLRHRLPKVVALPGRGFVTFTIKAEDITAADHLLATRLVSQEYVAYSCRHVPSSLEKAHWRDDRVQAVFFIRLSQEPLSAGCVSRILIFPACFRERVIPASEGDGSRSSQADTFLARFFLHPY